MNGTAVFEGRPVNGIIAHMLLGSATGFLAALFLWLTAFYNNPLPPGIMFSILAAVFLATAARRMRIRQVVVDGSGISFHVGGATRWSIPWSEVRSVGNRRSNWGASTVCLFLRTYEGELCLKDGTDLGPRKKLLALFVHLASCARERRVSVHDHGSWLAESRHPERSFEDRLTGTWQMEVPKDLDSTGYENKWLIGRDYTNIPWFLATVISIFAGILLFCLAACDWEPGIALVLLLVFLPTGGLIFVMGVYAWMKRITHVYFDNDRITLRLGNGHDKTLRWMHLRRCRFDTDTRRLDISSDYGNFLVLLDEHPTLAICKRFTAATGRPAHIFNSHVSDPF